MNLYPLLLLAALLGCCFVWSVVYSARRPDPVNRAFLLLVGVAAAWLVVDLVQYTPLAQGHELQLLRFAVLFWLPIGHLFLHFVYRLLGRRLDVPYLLSLGLLAAALVVGLTTELAIYDFVHQGWGTADIRGPAHFWVSLAPAPPTMAGVAALWRARHRSRERRRLRNG